MRPLLDLLLPHRCPICARPGPAPCGPCIADLPPPPALPPPPGLDACVAATAYRDGGRAVVAALKFTGARGSATWVADELAARLRAAAGSAGPPPAEAAVGPSGATGWPGRANPVPPADDRPVTPAPLGLEVVTWVPTTAAHRRRRGVDQAEVLAAAVAGALGLPCRSLLRRLPGPPQAGRGAAARRLGPPLAVRRGSVVPAGVLVVDDVVTSGGSVAAAARALRAAGAGRVVAAAAARTPPPRHRR